MSRCATLLRAAASVVADMPPIAVLELASPHTLDESVRKQIAADVRRSRIQDLPDLGPAHHAALEHLLCAWCVYEPRLGYVQGMNFAAAICLHVTEHDEEGALLLFAALIARCPPGFFDEGLSGLLVEATALLALVESRTTLLDAETAGAQMLRQTLPFAVTQWFLTLWAGVLPTDCVLRVWEALLTSPVDEDGASSVLLGVAMALIERSEARLATAQQEAEQLGSEGAIFVALQGVTEVSSSVGLGDREPGGFHPSDLPPSHARVLRAAARRHCGAAAQKLNAKRFGTPTSKVLAWVSKPAQSWRSLRKTAAAQPAPMLRCQREFLGGSRTSLPAPAIPWQETPLGKVGGVELTAGGAVVGATLLALLAV